jgi:hypothetical protein
LYKILNVGSTLTASLAVGLNEHGVFKSESWPLKHRLQALAPIEGDQFTARDAAKRAAMLLFV